MKALRAAEAEGKDEVEVSFAVCMERMQADDDDPWNPDVAEQPASSASSWMVDLGAGNPGPICHPGEDRRNPDESEAKRQRTEMPEGRSEMIVKCAEADA